MITITENELFRFKKMEENDAKWQKMLKFVEEKHVGQIRKGRAKTGLRGDFISLSE